MFGTSDIQTFLGGMSLGAGRQSGGQEMDQGYGSRYGDGTTDSRNTKEAESVGAGCWRRVMEKVKDGPWGEGDATQEEEGV